jgi:hypothetical protein
MKTRLGQAAWTVHARHASIYSYSHAGGKELALEAAGQIQQQQQNLVEVL